MNGDQSITIHVPQEDADLAVPVLNLFIGPNDSPNQVLGCKTILDDRHNSSCIFNSKLLRQISYQAILESFFKLISGKITMDESSDECQGICPLVDDSSVRSTVFTDTQELKVLTDYSLASNAALKVPNLQQEMMASDAWSEASGLGLKDRATANESLKDAIEAMFQRSTVSLMSSPVFQYVCLQLNFLSPSCPLT